MKINILPHLAVLLSVLPLAAQRVITVDNRPGAVAMFSTFSDAYAAAEDGDTILLSGSNIPYDDDTVIEKRLHIRGPGYFMSEHEIDQVNRHSAQIFFRFNDGSSGSTVKGVELITNSSPSNRRILVEHGLIGIHLDQVYFVTPTAYLSPVKITRSYAQGYLEFYPSSTGTEIENSRVNALVAEDEDTQIELRHCYYLSSAQAYRAKHSSLVRISNSIIKNDISIHGNPLINNSIFTGDYTGRGLGNLTNIPAFGDSGVLAYEWYDRIVIREDGPAKNAASDGTDIGPSGGDHPLIPGGIGVLPRLTLLEVPEAVTDFSGLQFEVGAAAAQP